MNQEFPGDNAEPSKPKSPTSNFPSEEPHIPPTDQRIVESTVPFT